MHAHRRGLCLSEASQNLTEEGCCCAVVWRESVVIGETDLDPQEVQEVVQQLGTAYRGNAYHLLERNCNHFSDELCHKLTGHHAPPWVCIVFHTAPSRHTCIRHAQGRHAQNDMVSWTPLQVNRLAGLAIMLHCLLPSAWVPPLSPPTARAMIGAMSPQCQLSFSVCACPPRTKLR